MLQYLTPCSVQEMSKLKRLFHLRAFHPYTICTFRAQFSLIFNTLRVHNITKFGTFLASNFSARFARNSSAIHSRAYHNLSIHDISYFEQTHEQIDTFAHFQHFNFTLSLTFHFMRFRIFNE